MAMSWQYISGFFDGEGNISTPLGHGSLHLGITQAGKSGIEVLTEIQNFLAIRGIKSRMQYVRHIKDRKPVYVLYMSTKAALPFLKSVYPYLRVKRVQALDVIRHRTLYPGMFVSPLCRAWRREQGIKHNVARTHCSKGHLLSDDNVYSFLRAGRPSKSCKICAKARADARYKRIVAKRCNVDERVRPWL